jgi:hypothetical protein
MSIPRDNYIGEPQYPDTWTTKTPREGLRDIDEARIVSLAPDVCLTPVGSSVVPIPYPVVNFCGHDKNYTSSVRFTGKKAMVMRSCTTHVHGDAPGVRKGVKSGTVESICEPIGHADQVRAEGSHVIRHLDRFHMNNRNTEGEAIFVRSTKTYDPPKDDDPVRGSLRAIEVADASEKQKRSSDAAPSGGAALGFLVTPGFAPLVQGAGGAAAGGASTAAGAATSGAGGAAAAAGGVSLGTILAGIGIFAAGVLIPTNKMNFSDTVPQDDFEQKLLLDAQRRINELPFWDSGADIRTETFAKIQEHRKENKPTQDPEPKPVPVPPPGSNVRIDEDENRRCRLLIICFMPTKSTIDLDEFKRQMELQEQGLNNMSPQQMLANQAKYLANPAGMRALSEPLQAKARQEYRNDPRIQKMYVDKYGPVQGPIKLGQYLDSAAALHNPDMIAGGKYNSVVDQTLPIENRIGGLSENSSMGSQWINPNRNGHTRASRLTEHAKRQAANNCPSVQVDLRLCPSNPSRPGEPLTGT